MAKLQSMLVATKSPHPRGVVSPSSVRAGLLSCGPKKRQGGCSTTSWALPTWSPGSCRSRHGSQRSSRNREARRPRSSRSNQSRLRQEPAPHDGKYPFTPRAKAALERAVRAAFCAGTTQVRPVHRFHAIVDVRELPVVPISTRWGPAPKGWVTQHSPNSIPDLLAAHLWPTRLERERP